MVAESSLFLSLLSIGREKTVAIGISQSPRPLRERGGKTCSLKTRQ
jgi:hypothetical protein